jgi:hypothetical protein
MAMVSEQQWNLPLDSLIEIEDGDHRLATLRDVGMFILSLPERVKGQELWQAAAETVLEAAESGDTARVPIVLHMALLMSGRAARCVWDEAPIAPDGPDLFPWPLTR